MSILGREAIVKWTAPDATEFEMNRIRDDSGDPVRPYVKLRRVGHASLGDAPDNRDPLVGADGEVPRLSRRRGKTVPYEGIIRAESVRELREYQAEIRQAFSDRNSEGRVDVIPHPLATDLAGMERYFNARVIGLEMEDVRDTQRFESTFVLGLRMSDARYFEVLTLARFKAAMLDVLGEYGAIEGVLWALDAVDGDTDLANGTRDGTGNGGVTIGGGAALLPGAIPTDSSTAFDGTDDDVRAAFNMGANQSFTHFGWALQTASGLEGLFSHGGAFLRIEADDDMVFTINGSDLQTYTDAWPGASTPVFWAVTSSETENRCQLYIQGVGLGERATTDNYPTGAQTLKFGTDGTNFLAGRMSFCGAVERELTAAEIALMYEYGQTGLQGYW